MRWPIVTSKIFPAGPIGDAYAPSSARRLRRGSSSPAISSARKGRRALGPPFNPHAGLAIAFATCSARFDEDVAVEDVQTQTADVAASAKPGKVTRERPLGPLWRGTRLKSSREGASSPKYSEGIMNNRRAAPPASLRAASFHRRRRSPWHRERTRAAQSGFR